MAAQTDEQQDAFRELPVVKRVLDGRERGYTAGVSRRPVSDITSLRTSPDAAH